MGFSFIFFQLSLVFSFANFVQYATFMSARAYLSGSVSKEDQEERAARVLSQTVKKGTADRFPGLGKGINGGAKGIVGATIGEAPGYEFDGKVRAKSWAEGVRYDFRSRILVVPLRAVKLRKTIELKSESWLGREPTESECLEFLKKFTDGEEPYVDNGC